MTNDESRSPGASVASVLAQAVPGGNGKPSTDPFYIEAASPLADERSLVLKHGETFAVFDHFGDIKPGGLGEEGLYQEGTRFLSCFLLKLGRGRPLFLSSTVKEDNDLLTVDLTNPDVRDGQRIVIPRGTLHLLRARFLWHGVCYERIHLRNYGLEPIEAYLTLHFEADFADIFEVRGTKRNQRGRLLETVREPGAVVLAYEGLDKVVRRTRLDFWPAPDVLGDADARFNLALPPQAETSLVITASCEASAGMPVLQPYDQALVQSERAFRTSKAQACEIQTSNAQFNEWLNRSAADLHMMVTETERGLYPFAGVPWFSTVFGRDGIITALEYLWLNPSLAKGVLGYLAATQAQSVIREQDAEPGKILHETRKGEMAQLGEIPFGRYYGSVDSTPLFVMLAAAYYERTGDRPFIESLWPNIERALQWIDTYGDLDRDGFVEYMRHSPSGLVQQGWKDSHDSVSHEDGQLAYAPIALCEVQGYVFAAKQGAASIASALEMTPRAEELLGQSRLLRDRFHQSFWCEELSTFALALDGDKRPCKVRASNAGHCLFTGIARPVEAWKVVHTLTSKESYSGWGVRTLAASERRYNPMAYHNGSIWPHDNAMIAQGFSRYGAKGEVLKLLAGFFEASIFLDLHRMPELFCGFPRRTDIGPTLYPVACAPQAWAAGAVFMLLQACLGLHVQAVPPQVRLHHPLLPEFLKEVWIHNLRVNDASLDLFLHRHGADVAINVPRKEGNIEVVIVK